MGEENASQFNDHQQAAFDAIVAVDGASSPATTKFGACFPWSKRDAVCSSSTAPGTLGRPHGVWAVVTNSFTFVLLVF